MRHFPWFDLMNMQLSVYFSYVKKVNEILRQEEGVGKGKLFRLRAVLFEMEEELNNANRLFLEINLFENFPGVKNSPLMEQEVNVVGLYFRVPLN